MPTFATEHERLCARRARELGRELDSAETRQLEGELFQQWIDAGRLDELVRTVLARHGRDGGLDDIIVLGHHLRQVRDEARIHALFGGLLSRRVKAFHEWWPRAAEGHLGCMQSAARAAAEAMDAYIEYFHSLHALGLQEQCDALRAGMLRFQAREPLKAVLPAARPAVSTPRGS